MKAKAYFEALGRSASSRGLPITETRIMRQERKIKVTLIGRCKNDEA